MVRARAELAPRAMLRQQARGATQNWLDEQAPTKPAVKPMDFSIFFFSASNPEQSSTPPGSAVYQTELTIAKLADAAGFTAIWTPERHFQSFGSAYPNPSLLSTALATCTSRLQIRAGSVVITLHHPIRVAEEWAVVDNLSDGRVGIGLAKGWHQADFVLDPQAFADRENTYWQRIDQIRRLWRGEAVAFPGVDGKMQTVQTFPRPVQAELPMWVTISGVPETWREAGKRGMNVMSSLTDRNELKANIALYRAARANHGHDPDSGQICIMLHSFVGPDDETVREIVREPMRAYLRTFLMQKIQHQIARGIHQQVSEEAIEGLLDMSFEDFYQHKSLLGTAEKCAALVRELQTDGVTEIACLINFGVDTATIVRGFEHLTELKNLFAASAEQDGGKV